MEIIFVLLVIGVAVVIRIFTNEMIKNKYFGKGCKHLNATWHPAELSEAIERSVSVAEYTPLYKYCLHPTRHGMVVNTAKCHYDKCPLEKMKK